MDYIAVRAPPRCCIIGADGEDRSETDGGKKQLPIENNTWISRRVEDLMRHTVDKANRILRRVDDLMRGYETFRPREREKRKEARERTS